jgi:hypothetical protein
MAAPEFIPVEYPECQAYKPWIRTSTHDGKLQKACRECPYLGRCEWTGEAEVEMAHGEDAE